MPGPHDDEEEDGLVGVEVSPLPTDAEGAGDGSGEGGGFCDGVDLCTAKADALGVEDAVA